MSLIKCFYPDVGEAVQIEYLTRLLNTTAKRRVVETTGLQEVLAEMQGTDDAKDFKGLRELLEDEKREELVIQRLGGVRAGVEMKTPSPIKRLRPPTQGSLVVLQISQSAFQAYYPRQLTAEQKNNPRVKKSWSIWRSFGVDRTQAEALRAVLQFVWKKHKDAGGDMSGKPTDEQIEAALQRTRRILAGEEPDESDDEKKPDADDATSGPRIAEHVDNEEDAEMGPLPRHREFRRFIQQ